jgi:hypothetical protein
VLVGSSHDNLICIESFKKLPVEVCEGSSQPTEEPVVGPHYELFHMCVYPYHPCL